MEHGLSKNESLKNLIEQIPEIGNQNSQNDDIYNADTNKIFGEILSNMDGLTPEQERIRRSLALRTK